MLIDKVIKKYLNYKFSSNQNQLKETSDVYYFKLPYIGTLSHHIKNKLSNFAKDPISDDLKFFLVYKFTCASCSCSYIGETLKRHFKTRIEEHIKKDNKCISLHPYMF